jgi:citrate/tricarballylate utilization protein
MEICNACRYCEGFCAVFPAMELRRSFADADLTYLANLCHNCQGCYYACQYAPPHEFGINLPRTFAELRAETYATFAWPPRLARLFARNGLVVSLVAALTTAVVLLLTSLLQTPDAITAARPAQPGSFYAVIPLWVMVLAGLATFGFALLALGASLRGFWRETAPGHRPSAGAVLRALVDLLTLRYLGGGGHGCNDRDESFSMTRRWLHHAMFYGFLLCFAATTVGFIYQDFLGWAAPYPLLSIPVLLGSVGGLALLCGTVGLFAMKLTADRELTPLQLLGADVALLLLLALAAATGLGLLALRTTSAMGIALAIHLGVALALFLVLPYSKFVHAIYRAAALLRYATERHT